MNATIQHTSKSLKLESVVGYAIFGLAGIVAPLVGAGAYQQFGLPNAPMGAAAGLAAVALAVYAWRLTWRIRRWWHHA